MSLGARRIRTPQSLFIGAKPTFSGTLGCLAALQLPTLGLSFFFLFSPVQFPKGIVVECRNGQVQGKDPVVGGLFERSILSTNLLRTN